MTITISGSMKFINEIESCQKEFEAIGAKVLIPNKNSLGMSIRKLLDDHLKKIDVSDYLLVVNENNYIGEGTRIEMDYAISKHKPIIFKYCTSGKEPRKFACFKPTEAGHSYYLHLPDTYMLPDTILETMFDVEFIRNSKVAAGSIAKAKLLSRPNKPNVNGVTYTEESLKTTMCSSRMTEFITTGALGIEFGESINMSHEQMLSINPINVVGVFACCTNKYLYLFKTNNYDILLDDVDESSLVAGMRYTAERNADGVFEISSITTWDIWPLKEKDTNINMKTYLERLESLD